MADTKISALPPATTPVAGTEELPIVQAGTTDRLTINGIFTGTGRQIPFDLGLITAPSVSFNGDLDTGVWSSSANTLDFSVGGLRGLQIGTTGASGNYVRMFSNNTPSVAAGGTNQFLNLSSSGTGGVSIFTGGTSGTGTSSIEVARFTNVASGVNYVDVTGGATGAAVVVRAAGSDAGIPLNLISKGTAAVNLYTGGGGQLAAQFPYTASAVNYLTMTGAATTASPVISVAGSDTNIGMTLRSKGTGEVNFSINSWTQFAVQNVATAPDYPVAGGGSSTAYIGVGGSNTNVPIRITSKGSGQVQLWTNTSNSMSFTADFAASAVNYLSAAPAATGAIPTLSAAGSDANVSATFASKGSGSLWFSTNGSTNYQMQVIHVSSAVNYVRVAGAATAGAPYLAAVGSDTNIDLQLYPKGSGVLMLGSTAPTVAVAAASTHKLPIKIGATTHYILVTNV